MEIDTKKCIDAFVSIQKLTRSHKEIPVTQLCGACKCPRNVEQHCKRNCLCHVSETVDWRQVYKEFRDKKRVLPPNTVLRANVDGRDVEISMKEVLRGMNTHPAPVFIDDLTVNTSAGIVTLYNEESLELLCDDSA